MHLASHRLSERCSVSVFLFFLLPIPLPAFSGQEPDLTFHALVQKSAASATFRYLCQRREDERCCRLLAPHSQLQGQRKQVWVVHTSIWPLLQSCFWQLMRMHQTYQL